MWLWREGGEEALEDEVGKTVQVMALRFECQVRNLDFDPRFCCRGSGVRQGPFCCCGRSHEVRACGSPVLFDPACRGTAGLGTAALGGRDELERP